MLNLVGIESKHVSDMYKEMIRRIYKKTKQNSLFHRTRYLPYFVYFFRREAGCVFSLKKLREIYDMPPNIMLRVMHYISKNHIKELTKRGK